MCWLGQHALLLRVLRSEGDVPAAGCLDVLLYCVPMRKGLLCCPAPCSGAVLLVPWQQANVVALRGGLSLLLVVYQLVWCLTAAVPEQAAAGGDQQ